jgi:3-methyladenine DNA glycosylase AlkD
MKPEKETDQAIHSLLTEIRAELQAHADPVRVKKYARYFVEGYDAYGVDLEGLRQQREEWFKEYQEKLGMEGFLQAGRQLAQSGKYEEGFIAIDFAYHYLKQLTPAVLDELGEWLENGLCNWAHVDTIANDILPEFIHQKIVSLSAFSEWRTSPSKWKRRAVPVTLIKSLKGSFTTAELLDFIRPMMEDDEKVVRQGLGWFLREAWKGNPKPVEAFLLEWKERCARLIIQYATEKMDKSNKLRFQRNKKTRH